jgi:hypothetical protein
MNVKPGVCDGHWSWLPGCRGGRDSPCRRNDFVIIVGGTDMLFMRVFCSPPAPEIANNPTDDSCSLDDLKPDRCTENVAHAKPCEQTRENGSHSDVRGAKRRSSHAHRRPFGSLPGARAKRTLCSGRRPDIARTLLAAFGSTCNALDADWGPLHRSVRHNNFTLRCFDNRIGVVVIQDSSRCSAGVTPVEWTG